MRRTLRRLRFEVKIREVVEVVAGSISKNCGESGSSGGKLLRAALRSVPPSGRGDAEEERARAGPSNCQRSSCVKHTSVVASSAPDWRTAFFDYIAAGNARALGETERYGESLAGPAGFDGLCYGCFSTPPYAA